MALTKIGKTPTPIKRMEDALKVSAKDYNDLVDAFNAVVPEIGTAKANTIEEYTAGSGVEVDGVLLKDSNITALEKIVNVTDATYTVTAAQTGTTFTLNRAGGIVITLPAASVGLHYKFVIGTTFSGTFKISAAHANDGFSDASLIVIYDKDLVYDSATAQILPAKADGTDDDEITMDADTKGRFIGTNFEIIGLGVKGSTFSKVWLAKGVAIGDGALATPFV
jgi:hypothetical protein